jgi:hypothetical protein
MCMCDSAFAWSSARYIYEHAIVQQVVELDMSNSEANDERLPKISGHGDSIVFVLEMGSGRAAA